MLLLAFPGQVSSPVGNIWIEGFILLPEPLPFRGQLPVTGSIGEDSPHLFIDFRPDGKTGSMTPDMTDIKRFESLGRTGR